LANARASLLADLLATDMERCAAALKTSESAEAVQADGTANALSLQDRTSRLLARFDAGHLHAEMVADRLARVALSYPVAVSASAHAYLTKLAETFPLALVSNTKWTSGRVLRELLDRQGADILRLFTAVVFSDEFGRAKPDPSVFVKAWTRHAFSPSATVHIGDRTGEDIRGIRAVGGRAILARHLRDDRETDELGMCDGILFDFVALPDLLDYLAFGPRQRRPLVTFRPPPIACAILTGRLHIDANVEVPAARSIYYLQRHWAGSLESLKNVGCVLAEDDDPPAPIVAACASARTPLLRGAAALSSLLTSGQIALVDPTEGAVFGQDC